MIRTFLNPSLHLTRFIAIAGNLDLDKCFVLKFYDYPNDSNSSFRAK